MLCRDGWHWNCRSVSRSPWLAALDFSPLACAHLRRNYDFPVLCGSVTSDEMLCQLQCASSAQPCIHTVGFPCQPFSRQGDLRGLKDDRVSALWGSLRSMYLCQALAGVLECVVGAGRHETLQQILRSFCGRMGWSMKSVEIDLAARWPCHRLRWWAILCAVDLPVELMPWSKVDRFPSVSHVVPSWPIWHADEEAQLCFTDEEVRYFEDPQFGKDDRLLVISSKCPTFLHSYGHGLLDCPCQCRRRFTEARLQSGGLRGFGIQSEVLHKPRFMHCQEVGFLQTVPATTKYIPGRPELVLLGQIAAPMQAVWILHPLLSALAPVNHEIKSVTAESYVQQYMEGLMISRHDFWCWPDTCKDRHVALECENLPNVDFSFLRVGPCVVSDLLRAESIFLNWGEKAVIHDGPRVVPSNAFVQSTGFFGAYRMVRKQKSSCDQIQNDLVFISLRWQETDYVSYLPAGSFLFQVLWDNSLTDQMRVYDQWGNHVSLDLKLFDNGRFIGKEVSPPVGFGLSSGTNDGLSASFMLHAFGSLLEHFGIQFQTLGIYECSYEIQGFSNAFFVELPCEACPTAASQVFVILEDAHWSVLQLTCHDSYIEVIHYDGLRSSILPKTAKWLYRRCASRHGIHRFQKATVAIVQQLSASSCGTVALVHALYALGLPSCDDSVLVDGCHDRLVSCSRVFFDDRVGFGPPRTVAVDLAQMLVQHGVPEHLAADRAAIGMKKLGTEVVTKALAGPKPWATLKEIASRPGISMQWVRSEELKAQIDARAASKFKIQPSQKKHNAAARRGREEPRVFAVDPQMLKLLPSTFEAQGKDMTQISLDEVKTNGTGLAFASPLDVAPYLRQGITISDRALAVLCTAQLSKEQCNGLTSTDLQFPVLYTGTSEPILLSGSLIQLGKVPVTRSVGLSLSVDSVNTQTLRFVVFRDAFPVNWMDFAKQPFRCVLREIPALQLCRETGCGHDCEHYHCAVDEELDHLVLDLWARAWHSSEGRFVKCEQASFWSALLRVPASASLGLQALSGTKGVFLEPRSSSGKESDKNFQIVWLQECTVEEAMHKQRTTPNAVAITRIAQKFGLRFQSQHYEEGFKALKPTEVYIPVKVTKVWKLFPLPFGTQRTGLQKMLTSFKWEAKVLQQVASSAVGACWEVGASQDPPMNVLQIGGKDVMVTFEREASKVNDAPMVVASSGTREHLKGLKSGQNHKLDPWLSNDPWSQFRPASGGGNGAQGSTDKMKQLESRLKAELESTAEKLRGEMTTDHSMDCSSDAQNANEERFSRLEVGMTEMKQQNDKLESWVHQMYNSNQQTCSQVQQLQAQVVGQQKEFESFRQEVVAQASATSQQFQEIRTEVQSEMQKGFAHIAGLLEKKQRVD